MDSLSIAELDRVPWSELEHAYGTAADVPDMLRDLTSADANLRATARDGLHASLDHQGVQRSVATLHAIPFLLGLVAAPATAERGELVRLLAELAVGDTCWFLHDGMHPEMQVACDGTARPQACAVVRGRGFATRGFPSLPDGHLDLHEGSLPRAIYDAVAGGLPVYLAALDDADDELRAAVPFLLGFLTALPEKTARPLERLCEDPSERVRASAALGLSHACKFDPELRQHAFGLLSQHWHRELGDLERRCVALALVRFEEPERTMAVRGHLREALRAGLPAVRPDPEFPWLRIDSPPFVFCSTYLGTHDSDHDALRAPALAALTATTNPHDAADLAVWITRLWVPAEPGEPPASPGFLSLELRDTLTALVTCAAAWRYTDLARALDGRRVPTERGELAAWLELPLDGA